MAYDYTPLAALPSVPNRLLRLTALPAEVLRVILLWLDTSSLCTLQLTCRRLRVVSDALIESICRRICSGLCIAPISFWGSSFCCWGNTREQRYHSLRTSWRDKANRMRSCRAIVVIIIASPSIRPSPQCRMLWESALSG